MALMAACSEEERYGEEVTTTLRACIEQPATTKTSLSEPSSGLYKTLWTENDKIAVYAGASSTGAEFSLISGAGTNNGEFNGTIPSGSRLAVYPYSICGESSGSSIKVTLPEEQMYKPGNIPDNAYPMVAAPSESTLLFKNLCSVLKISMTGDLTVNSVLFLANNTDVKVSGNATVDVDNTVLTMDRNAGSRLILTCDGVKLSDTATDFYVIVPSQTYTGGFSLIIDTDKGKVQKTIKSDVTLKRSELYRISPFECRIDEDNKNIIFEDTHFKAYMLANFDKDNDGEISFDEALSVTEINVCTDTISSLAGIEHMVNLKYLFCEGSHVWDSATGEYTDSGILESLDVTHNTKLLLLWCSYNKLESLDVSNNSLLTEISCSGNGIKSLNIDNCKDIKYLSVESNLLTSLIVKNNHNLITLRATNNKLEEIDLRNNTNLERLLIGYNNLSSLDLSSSAGLTYLNADHNNITSINAEKCPRLEFLSCDNNHLFQINISKNTELQNLYLSNNDLKTIDISNNVKIQLLRCSNNDLASIDISKNVHLQNLVCQANKLTSLDLGNCPDLYYFCCDNNLLKELKVSKCPKLKRIQCTNNEIETLDISKLTVLGHLSCKGNPLKTLYIYENQLNNITHTSIPSTTDIVVGSEPDDDDPDGWKSREFWHRSLGMRFTATWCGYCPMMATSFKTAMTNYPDKIELVNLHASSSNLAFSGTSRLASIFNVTGYPTGNVDYRKRIGNSDSDYTARLIVNAVKETENNYPTKTGISFTSSVTGSTLNLDIKLYIKEKGDYKVTAILLEDGIVGVQNGAGNDYVHDRIARLSITDITGDGFSTSADYETVNKHYSAAIPSSLDKGNLHILVYVLKQYGSQTIIRTADYGDYYVDNAVSAAVGTTQKLILLGGNDDMTDGGEITLN